MEKKRILKSGADHKPRHIAAATDLKNDLMSYRSVLERTLVCNERSEYLHLQTGPQLTKLGRLN